MKRGVLAAAALAATALTGAATAETIVVGDGIAVRETAVPHPKSGMTMTAVESQFGQPATRHNAVGQPPITRWDYAGFSVYFEHQYVIHSVVSGS